MESNLARLTFEKGLVESLEDSAQIDGAAVVLENWVPEPTGGLRARRKWMSSNTSGAPSTRRTRGIGRYAEEASFATPTIRQNVQGSGTSTAEGFSPVSATWSSDTVEGNCLFVVVSATARNASMDPSVVSAPADWVLVKDEPHNSTTNYARLYLYVITNAASRSGAEFFTISGDGDLAAVVSLWEYSGVDVQDENPPATPVEGSGQSTTSTLTTSSVANTPSTATARTLWFAAFAALRTKIGGAFSAPTNGYTERLDTTVASTSVESGPRSTGTGANDAGTGTQAWANPGNILSSNDTDAAAQLTPLEVSNYLKATNFGFTIPTTAVVNGIKVEIERRSTQNNKIKDDRVRIVKGGVIQSTDKADGDIFWPATDAYTTYGGDGDLWGTTWAASDINASDFGVVLSAKNVQTTSTPTAEVDHIRITVYYSEVAAGQGVFTKSVTATGDPDMQVTVADSSVGVGVVAAFKTKIVDSVPVNILIANDDTAGANFDIYANNSETLDSGAWESVDANLAVTDRSLPVAFAPGDGFVLYTHRGFSAVRKWDGTTASSVAAAPLGRCITFHNNRFWIAGSVANPTRVWYSDLGDHTTWGANSFFDIVLDDNEPIEALMPFQDGLVVGKQTSLHYITGSGTDTFAQHGLSAEAGCAPGYTLCSTPHGCVVVGRKHVWLWDGGKPEIISRPIEITYEFSGNFMSAAYADDVLYVCDEGSGTVWAFDFVKQVWHTEIIDTAVERPAIVWGEDGLLLMGPKAATVNSSISYREHPGTERGRDADLSETFRAHTPQMWLGGATSPATPLNLHLRIRQRGGTTMDTGPSIIPYYDGVAQTTRTIVPQDASSAEKVFRERVDVGSGSAHYGVQFRFEHTVPSDEDAVMDIEAAELEWQQENPR